MILLSEKVYPGVYHYLFPYPVFPVGWCAPQREGYLGLPNIILPLY